MGIDTWTARQSPSRDHLGCVNNSPDVLAAVDSYFRQVPDNALRERTLLLTRTGSQAYGLDTPESDTDLCGVALPTMASIVGLERSFEQHAVHKTPDATVFELRKFLNNALIVNPAFVDPLFCDDEDVVIVKPFGEQLRAMRRMFLSQAASNAWLGYAQHTRKRLVGSDGKPNFKAGMHAIRASRVLARLHRDGVVEVRREKDRDELMAIRRGEMSVAGVLSLALHEETLAKDAEKKTVLPKEPERAKIHDWCMDVLAGEVVGWNAAKMFEAAKRIRAKWSTLEQSA